MENNNKKYVWKMIPTIMLGMVLAGIGIFFIINVEGLLSTGIIFIIAGVIVSFIRALDGIRSTLTLIWFLMIISLCILGERGVDVDEFAYLIIIYPVLSCLCLQLFDMFKFNGGKVSDEIAQKINEKINAFSDYIEKNSVRSSLFVRPTINGKIFCFANKYFILKFDLSDFDLLCFKIFVTDKTSGEGTMFNIINKNSDYRQNFPAETFNNFFRHIFKKIDYDLTADSLIFLINTEIKKFTDVKVKKEIQKLKNLYLDINQASEAELTAIPEVTIAKAKHAIKVRNKQKLFLSMNKFYEAINLDEEFVEQIHVKGNKILLNELPEYKMLEVKREE